LLEGGVQGVGASGHGRLQCGEKPVMIRRIRGLSQFPEASWRTQ
jgi:hypothetical protein